jgi:hypothetical protein
MKLRFLILIVFLAVVAQPALPQETSRPLGKDQVLDLVKFGLDSGELAKRINERGIDFEPTDDYLKTLRKAGAQEVVIHALREVRPKPLTREQVGQLVAGGVPNERASMLVKQRGIDFVADERYLQTLRVAGGDDSLIAALREASVAMARTHDELVALAHRHDRDYFEFSLPQRKAQQKVGTVTIEIEKSDAELSVFSIYLYFDGKRVQHSNKAKNAPVFFYPQGAPSALELVVNKVEKDSISGYISTPKGFFSNTPNVTPRPPGQGEGGETSGVIYSVGGDVSPPIPIYKPDPAYSA